MKNSFIRNFNDDLIAYGLPVLYFIISVLFYLRTYDSCQIKITLIQIGGTVLISLWLIKILQLYEFDFYKRNITILLPIILFLFSGIISYFRSPFKYASGMELVRRVIYMGIVLLVAKEFNSEEKIRRLMRWLFLAVFVSTFYGIIQFLDTNFFPPGPAGQGLDPFIWRGAFTKRVFSTFGNPNFYGDFLVVLGPLVLATFLKTRALYLLFLYLVISFNVFVTYSKGAWIGHTSSFVTFSMLTVSFFSRIKKGNAKKILIAITAVVIIAVASGVVYLAKERTDSIKFRVYTWLSCWEMINTNPILGTGIGTFYVTYPAWRRPQIFYIEGKHNTETDHPENEYLEVWYDEGLIGIGIFLWIICVVISLGITGLKKFSTVVYVDKKGKTHQIAEDPRAYYMLGFLSAFIGMLTHNFVCVSLRFVSSGIFLWLLVGLISAIMSNEPFRVRVTSSSPLRMYLIWIVFWTINFYIWKMTLPVIISIALCMLVITLFIDYNLLSSTEKSLPVSNVTSVEITPSGKILASIMTIAIICVCIYTWKIFYGYFVGDIFHNIAIFHSKRGNWSQALENYNKVATYNPGFIMCHYFMGNVFNDRWILSREYHPEWGDKKPRTDPERALAKYNDVKKLAPNYVQTHHQTGLVYLKLGELAKNSGDISSAMGYWNKAIESFEKYRTIDPVFPLNYYRMAWIYLQLGNIAKAEETYLKHANLYKLFIDAKEHNFLWEDWAIRRRVETAETYVNLGNLKFINNDYSKAEEYYNMALEKNKNHYNALKNLAILYGKTGRNQAATALWLRLRQINPEDPDIKRIFSNQPQT